MAPHIFVLQFLPTMLVLSHQFRAFCQKSSKRNLQILRFAATDDKCHAVDSLFSTESLTKMKASVGTTGSLEAINEMLPRPSNTTTLYGRNPTITMLALAHSQWSYIVRPGIDSVIDATTGNGGDALFLAKLLFDGSKSSSDQGQSRLICVDVDDQACAATRDRLQSTFPDFVDQCIHVLQVSHDPLPLPVDTSSIGLVTYNLGYLPHAATHHASRHLTQTPSTLASLAQAARVIRVGGMISVMTYPATNHEEDAVVQAFVTGLALFSSQTTDWKAYRYLTDEHWNQQVLERLQFVYGQQQQQQSTTWRVHEHKKLGWIDAPVLLTATRIK